MTTRWSERWVAPGLVALALGLAANSLLGPLVGGVVTYPFSETMVYQTIGLEAVTLFVVAPWCLVAAWLIRREHPAAPVLGIPPAAYTAYMFLQYVVGPEYQVYRPVVVFHLAIFVLSGVVLVRSWNLVTIASLPTMTARQERGSGIALLLFGGFLTVQYVPAARGFLTGGPLSAEALLDTSMYWSIFFLDLGVVLPVTVATSLGLFRGATWARKALYAVVGWYTLVPTSVAAMALVMLANGDPNTTIASVVMFAVAAAVFTLVAAWVYRPLFGGAASRDDRGGNVPT